METRDDLRLVAWWRRWWALPAWVRTPAALTAAALLLGAGALGHMTARLELRALRAEKAQLEHANRALRGAAPDAVLRALEEPEAAGAAGPVGPPAEPALRRRIARLEGRLGELGAEKGALEERVARLRKDARAAEQSQRAAREKAQRLAARLSELERRTEAAAAPSAPAASAPRSPERPEATADGAPREEAAGAGIAADAGAPGCSLEAPEFALTGRGEAVRRLGGRLELALEGEGEGLALAVGGVSGRRYALGDPPQRFAFECAGEPYIVSVCQVERAPPAVRGVIAPGDLWRGACRERAPVASGAAP